MLHAELFKNIAEHKYVTSFTSMEFTVLDNKIYRVIIDVETPNLKHKDIKIPIINNAKWKLVRKFLNSLVDNDHFNTCPLCYDKYSNNELTQCSDCNYRYCLECYLKLIKDGSGRITCPFCNITTGIELSDAGARDEIKRQRNNARKIYDKLNKIQSQ